MVTPFERGQFGEMVVRTGSLGNPAIGYSVAVNKPEKYYTITQYQMDSHDKGTYVELNRGKQLGEIRIPFEFIPFFLSTFTDAVTTELKRLAEESNSYC